MVTACIDSGPLMALSKLNALPKVFSIYQSFTISDAVYNEVVTLGLAKDYKDAKSVNRYCQNKKIKIFPSKEIKDVSLEMIYDLHKGELETIKIAIQTLTDYVFIDDFYARKVAEASINKASVITKVHGTLGILVELYQKKIISKTQFKKYIETIINRRDIWISRKLCHNLVNALDTGLLS